MLDTSAVSLIVEHQRILCKMLIRICKLSSLKGTKKVVVLCMHFVMIVDLAGPRHVEQMSND